MFSFWGKWNRGSKLNHILLGLIPLVQHKKAPAQQPWWATGSLAKRNRTHFCDFLTAVTFMSCRHTREMELALTLETKEQNFAKWLLKHQHIFLILIFLRFGSLSSRLLLCNQDVWRYQTRPPKNEEQPKQGFRWLLFYSWHGVCVVVVDLVFFLLLLGFFSNWKIKWWSNFATKTAVSGATRNHSVWNFFFCGPWKLFTATKVPRMQRQKCCFSEPKALLFYAQIPPHLSMQIEWAHVYLVSNGLFQLTPILPFTQFFAAPNAISILSQPSSCSASWSSLSHSLSFIRLFWGNSVM